MPISQLSNSSKAKAKIFLNKHQEGWNQNKKKGASGSNLRPKKKKTVQGKKTCFLFKQKDICMDEYGYDTNNSS